VLENNKNYILKPYLLENNINHILKPHLRA
jgi:hypothetical protein